MSMKTAEYPDFSDIANIIKTQNPRLALRVLLLILILLSHLFHIDTQNIGIFHRLGNIAESFCHINLHEVVALKIIYRIADILQRA